MTTTSPKLTPRQRRYYRIGVRLNRTGGWTPDRALAWCREQKVASTDLLWVLRGCRDEMDYGR